MARDPAMRNVMIAFAVLWLGACAPGAQLVHTARDQLHSSKKIAVDGYAGLQYDTPALDAPVPFALDESAVVMVRDGRRKFVKGFRLPEANGPLALNIVSYRLGTASDPAILYPDVRVLDANFREVGAIPSSRFVFRAMRSGEGITATHFVNDRNRGETYVVISERETREAEWASFQQNVTGHMPVQAYSRGMILTWFIPTGVSSPPVKIMASPAGKLEISFQPYRPLKVGE
jgi:hypothetical protein